MDYPKPIALLIESFSKLPSVGKKTAERMALYIYEKMSDEDILTFSNALLSVKNDVKHCKICGNMSLEDVCDICSSDTRDKSVIMVLETVRDLIIMEHIDSYKGVYHVLNGAISFSKGIGVDDLTIELLMNRIREGNIKEVILATNATLEGETTARYIKALIDEENPNIKVTRIAHGLPVGGDLQYADQMTILKALDGRTDY